MQPPRTRLSLLIVAACTLALAGCRSTGLGADEIARGRSSYNDVINRTNDEQTLQLIVRSRYGLTSGLMQVQSVTANMKFATRTTAQFPIGAEKYYLENLVPLEVGAAFEENPTISYMPISGERAIQSMLSPISLRSLVLLTRATGGERAAVFSFLVERLNGLPHPELGLPGSDRFGRAVALLDELVVAGVADWARPGDRDALQLVLFDYSGHRERVDELLELLALPSAPGDGSDIQLPLRLRVGSPAANGIQVLTRSMFGIVQLAAAAVDVPASHVEAGLVAPRAAVSPPPAYSLVVKSSEEPPDDATVAVLHDGWWFYIERTDHRSKLMFRILQRLFDLRVAATQPDVGAPVLTLPVN